MTVLLQAAIGFGLVLMGILFVLGILFLILTNSFIGVLTNQINKKNIAAKKRTTKFLVAALSVIVSLLITTIIGGLIYWWLINSFDLTYS